MIKSTQDILLITFWKDQNEIRLYKTVYRYEFKPSYHILWGPIGNCRSKTEIRTPTGRRPSINSVIKTFREAISATQYVKFS
jgi:hypothetical protein